MIPWMEAAWAGLMGLGFTVAAMPVYLLWARSRGWGQVIREEGPRQHHSKAGTPTMGGLVLLTGGVAASSWCSAPSAELNLLRWVLVFGGLLGLTDDLQKVLRNRNLGLRARDKLGVQALIGVGLGTWAWGAGGGSQPGPALLGAASWGVWIIPVALLVTASTMNAVNLTDGLDGLAASTCAVALLAYLPLAAWSGHPELSVAVAGLAGACLGFLWFNAFPARVFMGDTGSLGLGAALAALAVITHTEWLWILLGGVFVAEAGSVILQVAVFKLTGGRRLFRMSPLHHHFEHTGLHEVQVTVRFTLVATLLAVVSLTAAWRAGL